MVLANAASTLPGLLLGAVFASPPVLLLALPLVYAFTYGLAKRASDELAGMTNGRVQRPSRLAAWMTIVSLVALVPTGLLNSPGEWSSTAAYFTTKALALFFLLLPSIILTILWESLVVLPLSPKGSDRQAVFRAVVRANLATFATLFFVGAALAIPIRLRRGDWMMPFNGV